ncbi:MAG: DUF5132 domain-containing protein [Methylovirgula sp.]
MSTETTGTAEHAEPKSLNGATPVVAADQESSDLAAKVAIAGAIGVGAALIEASLIPGILIGAAAILAPKYLPGVREKMRPLLKSTIRGAYRLSEKTREAFAEAQEQVQDIMAEARHEDHEAKATTAAAAAPAHQD